MEGHGGSKVSGIRQIVRLKELLQKWQSVTLSSKGSSSTHPENDSSLGGISPAVSRRIRNANIVWDSDEESCHSPEPPHGVPKGYLAVYVGPELRRFIIPTSYLSHQLFKILLEKAEEEFGFDHGGGIILPCEIETFKYLLQCMENHEKEHSDDNDTKDTATEEETVEM